MEFSSLFRRSSTILGRGSPYFFLARSQVMEMSCSWAPSMKGGKLPMGTGRTCSILSAMRLGFFTTTS